MTERFRLLFGRWFGIVILAVIAGLVVWFLLNFNSVLYKVQNKLFATDAEREIKRLENLYKNDKYGGKTPEETFDLFIDALKKGDVELASKYFVLKKQDDWKRTLEEYSNQKILSDFATELEDAQKKWIKGSENQNSVQYSYTVKISENTIADFNGQKIPVEAGNYRNIVRFEKYPSGIWKINLL